MTAEECKKMLSEDELSILFVDVRETDEVMDDPYFSVPPKNFVNIPLGVVMMLPEEELRVRLAETATLCGKTLEAMMVVLACRSGGRSAMAQMKLSEYGIDAENLDGGRIGWGEVL